MRKLLVSAMVVVGLAIPAAAVAAPPSGGGFGSQPGYERIPDSAQCGSHAASGAFGAFGTYGYKHDYRGGANGTATGDANSGVCA